MNKLSKGSKSQLDSCHPVLQQCVMFALTHVDVGVTRGHRDEELQAKRFADGVSQLQWPNSKHNSVVSEAVDVVIYIKEFKYLWAPPVRYLGCEWFYMQYARLDTLMQLKANELGYTLRWGGKWDNPYDLLGNSLLDIFHWELGRKV